MSSYKFNFGIADDVLTGMNTVNNNINASLSGLDGYVRANLAEWIGDANSSYNNAKTIWDQASAQMTVHLDNARKALGQISVNYADTEARNRAVWDNTRTGL